MATLVDRINEMIDLLSVVNPEAAATFRGAAQPRVVYVTEPKAAAPAAVPAVAPAVAPAVQPSYATGSPPAAIGAPASAPVQEAMKHPLLVDLSPDTLIEGIILSEILGKPLSRRHPGRF